MGLVKLLQRKRQGLSLRCWGRGQAHGPSQLCFWILSLSLCRQKLLYKAVGVEEGVPIGTGKTRGCQALININYTKAWGCSAFVTLQAWSHLPVEGKWP